MLLLWNFLRIFLAIKRITFIASQRTARPPNRITATISRRKYSLVVTPTAGVRKWRAPPFRRRYSVHQTALAGPEFKLFTILSLSVDIAFLYLEITARSYCINKYAYMPLLNTSKAKDLGRSLPQWPFLRVWGHLLFQEIVSTFVLNRVLWIMHD